MFRVTGIGRPTDVCKGVPGPVITGGCDGVTSLAPLSTWLVCGVDQMVGLYAGKDGGVSVPLSGSTIL